MLGLVGDEIWHLGYYIPNQPGGKLSMVERARSGRTLGRRRERLSDEETARRVVDTATALVNRSGLTVGLDHISFEDVIRDAGVSRSSVYRRWPYKDEFFADLLRELARAAVPATIVSEAEGMAGIRAIAAVHPEWLDDAAHRRDLLIEFIRLGALHDFEAMLDSTEWRTYLALHATFMGVEDPQLREELAAGLAGSEERFVSAIARSWARMCALFGYRLRPGLGASFEILARMASADLRGHVLLALADSSVGAARLRCVLFGASGEAEWSLPALAMAAIADAFLEPDPAQSWDAARIASVRAELGQG